jgi:hypothetical protein
VTSLEVKEDVSALFEQVGFAPNSTFQQAILEAPHKFILVTGGGRGGKSMVAKAKWMQRWVEDKAKHPEDGNGAGDPFLYWLIGQSYGETRREFFYINDDLQLLGFQKPILEWTTRVDPGYIQIKLPGERHPRLRIETKSSQDITKMSQDPPHGIIVCEAGQQSVEVLERCQERVVEKDGWVLYIGTMEESVGWFPSLAPQWASGANNRKSFRLPMYANSTIFPGGRNDPKILDLIANSSDQFVSERIEGIPVPPKGLVFPEFRPDVHVQHCERVPGERVYIWEDPGYSGSYHAVEIANVISGQVRIFDEIYVKGLTTEEIIEICMARDWWKERDKWGVADLYVEQHHAQRPLQQIWNEKARLHMNTNRVRIPEGTERMKTMLKMDPITHGPKIIISPVCKGLISEFGAAPNPDNGQLRAYRWGTDREGNVMGKNPRDANNDAIKAVIYGLVDRFGYTHREDGGTIKVQRRNGSRRGRNGRNRV